eukprot:7808569-Ditylum_brightwellii.AAC.1
MQQSFTIFSNATVLFLLVTTAALFSENGAAFNAVPCERLCQKIVLLHATFSQQTSEGADDNNDDMA